MLLFVGDTLINDVVTPNADIETGMHDSNYDSRCLKPLKPNS